MFISSSNGHKMRTRGFTLIELLVVISIIGMLSSVVLASLSSARASSRDSKRIQSLIQLRTALELYRSVNNGYPVTETTNSPPGAFVSCTGFSDSWATSHTSDWIPSIVPQFISALPTDPLPLPSGASYSHGCYTYQSNGTDYKVTFPGVMEKRCTTGDTFNMCDASYTPGISVGSSAASKAWSIPD
ncbi:MAG: type II secretion system protein [Patescibacteria group bacterium]